MSISAWAWLEELPIETTGNVRRANKKFEILGSNIKITLKFNSVIYNFYLKNVVFFFLKKKKKVVEEEASKACNGWLWWNLIMPKFSFFFFLAILESEKLIRSRMNGLSG